MGLPVILTSQSQDDLRSIVSYIARDDSERARTFGYLLIDKALSIGPMPERGRVVPEVNDPAVREIGLAASLFSDGLGDGPSLC